jgi:hypothetical protein
VGHTEQRLQLIQGLLGLADQQVDPGELLLDIGSEIRVLSHRLQRDPTFSLTYRLRPSPRIRQREAVQGVRQSAVRRLLDNLFVLRKRGIGIDPRPLRLTAVLIYLRPDQTPLSIAGLGGAFDQLLEPRVAPERVERRIDP